MAFLPSLNIWPGEGHHDVFIRANSFSASAA
jgi:hypothetical protein